MVIREAIPADIPGIQLVRNAVRENRLSDPALVSDEDCANFLFIRGKGWVAEEKGIITGFAIADLKEHNIWALFVHPDHEKMGIGRQLHYLFYAEYYFLDLENDTTQSLTCGVPIRIGGIGAGVFREIV